MQFNLIHSLFCFTLLLAGYALMHRTLPTTLLRLPSTATTIMLAKLTSYWVPTSPDQLAQAEQAVLSHVKTPYTQQNIYIDDHHTNYINTLHFKSPPTTTTQIHKPLVLIHGFGAGNGFWLMNFDALAKQYTDVYSIDLLGCGRSSRPRFTAHTVEQTEAFFVDSIEAWRQKMQLQQMVLCGHSLGAYISSAYTLQHPSAVDTLILASPVGVGQEPPETAATHVNNTQRSTQIPLMYRMIRGSLRSLWQWGFSPQDIVRLMGPWGDRPVTSYVMRRFYMGAGKDDDLKENAAVDQSGMEGAEAMSKQIESKHLKLPKKDVATYLYHLCAAPGSGEYAITKLLKPTVYAHQPLVTRLPALARTSTKVRMLYGDIDWMDVNAGRETVKRLKQAGGDGKVEVVPSAGHQMMIDNPDAFNDLVIQCGR